MQDLTEEGHLWAGGSFDDALSFFGELTFSADGVELEHATLHFDDLVGPAHALNLVVGKGMATLSSFGPHSTYLGDMAMPVVPVTALYGATGGSFALMNNNNGLELNGTIGGRFDYSAGINAGANLDVQDAQDVYAHVGYKLGDMSLDGTLIGLLRQAPPARRHLGRGRLRAEPGPARLPGPNGIRCPATPRTDAEEMLGAQIIGAFEKR
jgi:hypothetical protein